MRLQKTAHTPRPRRVHEFTGDFELEDVWELLFTLRWKLGKLFGWDEADAGVGKRVPSLRERLPADLLEGAPRSRSARRSRADGGGRSADFRLALPVA
jgi:hypothetical protein